MKKIAFLGSRKWTDAQRIALQVNACYSEHGRFVLVSGGNAEGATHVAEATAQEFGLPVVSFRPVQITPEEYGVDEWRLFRGHGEITRLVPTFADWNSAAYYRSMLIAERAEEAWIYWDGYSRGTQREIDCFEQEGKLTHVANLRLEAGQLK